MNGAIYVAYGSAARSEVELSHQSLRKIHPRLGTKILTEHLPNSPKGLTDDQQAHWSKTSADLWSPYDPTLLIDADTRVLGDLSIGFKILRAGWELVMIPSVPPKRHSVLWSLSSEDREYTLEVLGTWSHIMLNTGVMFFRKTPNVRALFAAWREEWLKFKDRDQGAFLRALHKNPVQLGLLGSPFNSHGGEVVNHYFGRAQ